MGNQPSDLVARASALWTNDVQTALEARKLLDDALRIDPRYVPALVGRAWTLNHEFEDDPRSDRNRIVLEMDDLALEAGAQAMRLDPSNKDAFINQGWIMDVSGPAEKTFELLAQSRAIGCG
jgi:hypothetical protein